MFHWYTQAETCFAYLEDVPADSALLGLEAPFAKSRWFYRGWTLQELISLSRMLFFADQWTLIGAKWELVARIAENSGIGERYLREEDLRQASVAQRMSWASKRMTTRKENLAYCLLGIFDVAMPMLYGEGEKAFVRLQEEIMKNSTDHSLLGWGLHPFGVKSDALRPNLDTVAAIGSKSKIEENQSSKGVLPTSPAEFANSGHVVPYTSANVKT